MDQITYNTNNMGKTNGQKKIKRPATTKEGAKIAETLRKGLGKKAIIKKGKN